MADGEETGRVSVSSLLPLLPTRERNKTMQRRARYRLPFLIVQLLVIALLASPTYAQTLAPASPAAATGVYSNPLQPQMPGDGVVESCADPSIIRGQTPGDTAWYIYCTTDPLNDEDRPPISFPISRQNSSLYDSQIASHL